MVRILHPDDLPAVPWKNGGGITREIARADNTRGLIWRISIADVATDGPFSRFEGLTRILTVIAGAGVDLVTNVGVITAHCGSPVRFSGDTAVVARLIQGPIRDLNLIFDASQVNADVVVLTGPAMIETKPGSAGCLALSGTILLDATLLPVGAFVLGQPGQIKLGDGAKALLLTISDVSSS